ncbi:MAG TPA: heme o synthase [Burkholderiaceae bacterium]|nr:heme o synthase [Burkholderiaceae bacterium]
MSASRSRATIGLHVAGASSLRAAAARYYSLTKPRVIWLIVFCAAIGMLLASPRVPPLRVFAPAMIGIWLIASAAAAFNCLVERHIDARMVRTARRPTAAGQLAARHVLAFSTLLCATGAFVLYLAVNPLTLWLTLATFVGYAVVYTLLLKPMTPQNIVIGGLSGAMPPVLGWVALTGQIEAGALILCLIIFLWTPPHFWALALYRLDDYRSSGLPMLPVTHGVAYTRRQIFIYTAALAAATLLPVAIGMSGRLYLVAACALDAVFIRYAWRLWRRYSDRLAWKTFRFSIVYLALLFLALLVDHYVMAGSALAYY